MTGHIKLGESGDLRAYALSDPMQYRAQPINPMAAKIGQGAGSYDDFMGWAFWLMEDWQTGAGRRAGEGVLFGDVSTFMGGRLALPLQCWPVNTRAMSADGYGAIHYPWVVQGEMTIGEGQTYNKLALYFGNRGDVQQCWFYVNPFEADTFTVSLERAASPTNYPTETIAYRTVIASDLAPHPQWVLLDLGSPHTIGGTWYYWLCISCTSGTLQVPYGVRDPDYHKSYLIGYKPSTAGWSTLTDGGDYLTCYAMANMINDSLAAGGWSAEEIVDAVQWGNGIWVYGRAYLYKLTAAANKWDDTFGIQTYAAPPSVVDLQVHDDLLWAAAGSGGLWKRTAGGTDSEVLKSAARFPVSLLVSWQGYLWAAYQNDLYYTGDGGTTWTGPIEVGPDGYEVRSMAGLGDYLYLATDEALWRLAPGDVIEGVTPWPSISSTNGRRMIVHAGAIYIPMKNRIWMFSQSGAFQDVWVDSTVDLPAQYLGEIHSLATSHMGLLVTVNPVDASLSPSVWLLGSEGWHVLATLPPGSGAGRVVVDAIHNRLWVATRCGLMWSIYFEPLAALPVRNAAQSWAACGWLEWDWYTGDLVDVDKDWESVTIFGEGLSANQSVDIYYQTTDGGAWRHLGTATGDNVEVRFDQLLYRPVGPKLRLGLLLRTNDWGLTPVVRAMRIKYMPMLFDRWRWQMALPVHDNQQMPDGTINPYTAAEMRSHIEALITRVAPFVLEDLDGVQYEVKVQGATRNVEGWSWLPQLGEPVMRWVYALTLDQVTEGRYLPTLTTTLTVAGFYRLGAGEVLRIADGGWLRVVDDVSVLGT